MSGAKSSALLTQDTISTANPDVPVTEEERRKIKQQSMKKKKPEPQISPTQTEEWLTNDKNKTDKSKKFPQKPTQKQSPRSNASTFTNINPHTYLSDDDESTLESASHTHLRKPTLSRPVLSNIQVTAFLSQLSGAKAREQHSGDGFSGRRLAREVWTCGQNSYGELAHGDTNNRKSHSQVHLLDSKEVVQVAAGNEHTAVLTRDGKIYAAGYNDNGQCGQGHQQRVSELALITQLPAGKKAVQVHAYNGCEHTMVVMEDGRLFSFGYNYRGQLGHGTTVSELVPRPVRGLEGKQVRLVSCSYYHTVVACDNDEAYSFGRNDSGQLGHGDTADKKFPQSIDTLKGRRLVSLGCGQYHTCVVTAQGAVLSCGKNDYGQLGIESCDPQKRMVQVAGALDNERVTELRCGYYHTIVLVERGRVYGFGRNDYGQLGLGQINSQRVLGAQLIGSLDGKNIAKIAAGCYHSVFAAQNGMVYVCGRNNHGQLGTGDTNERHVPFPIDSFLGKRVSMIASGFYHTIILTGRDEQSGNIDPASSIGLAPDYSSQKVLALPCLAWSSDSSINCRSNNVGSGNGNNNMGGSSCSSNSTGSGGISSNSSSNNNDDDDNENKTKKAADAGDKASAGGGRDSAGNNGSGDRASLSSAIPSSTIVSVVSSSAATTATSSAVIATASAISGADRAEQDQQSSLHRVISNEKQQQHDQGSVNSTVPTTNPSSTHPEDINNIESIMSTDAAPFDDGCSEVTLPTNAQTNQDNFKFHHQNDGTSLFEEDGSVRQDKTALFMLAHLERLATSLIPSPDFFPVIGICAEVFSKREKHDVDSANVAGEESEGENRNSSIFHISAMDTEELPTMERYCVDIHPLTFKLLAKLITTIHESNASRHSFTCTLLLDENRSFLILSCLRILKANLCRLLNMGMLAGKIRVAMIAASENTAASSSHLEPTSAYAGIEEFGNIGSNETIMPAHLLNVEHDEFIASRYFKQDSDDERHRTDDGKNSRGESCEILDFVNSLHHLHCILINVIESPSFFNEAASTVQSEAASILIMGIDFFYPSQRDQIQLLADLFACPIITDGASVVDHTDHVSAIEEDSQYRDALSAGLSASRFFLLDPLLDRLADDRIVSCLVPNPSNFSVDVPGARVTPSVPDVSNLNTLLRLLVKQIIMSTEANTLISSSLDLTSSYRFDDESSDQEASNLQLKNHRKNMIKLVLSILKHLLHWAAQEKALSSDDGAPFSMQTTDDPIALLEACLSKSCSTSFPPGSASLLEFATLAMLHSVELLTELINFGKKQRGGADEYVLTLDDTCRIENGVIGTILPSLILGLLPFASRLSVAKRLLPLVTTFLQRLDALLDLCPYLLGDANNNCGGTFGAPSHQHQDNSASASARDSKSEREAMKNFEGGGPATSDALKTALANANKSTSHLLVPPMNSIPWMGTLIKSCTLLAGNLAKTLVRGCSSEAVSSKFVAGTLRSSLYKNGIDHCFNSLMGRFNLVLSSKSSSASTLKQSSPYSSSQCAASSNTAPGGVMDASTLNHSVPLLADDKKLISTCNSLRKIYISRDLSYCMISKQFQNNPVGQMVARFECLFLAAALKHAGLSDFAKLYASRAPDNRGDLETPSVLKLSWRVVAEATKWLWSRRSELKAAASSSENAEDQIDRLFQSVTSTLCLLTLLAPCHSAAPLPFSSCLKPDTSKARRRWRRCVNFVTCALRWKRIAQHAECLNSIHVQSTFNFAWISSKSIFSHVRECEKLDRKFYYASSPSSSLLISWRILVHLIQSYKCCSSRVAGLHGFHTLFSSIKLKASRSVTLSEFTRAIKASGYAGRITPSKTIIFEDTASVGATAIAVVEDAFQQVLALLTSELEKFLSLKPSAISNKLQGSTTGNAANFALLSNIDSRFYLLLLDAWGVNFDGKSSEFLVESRIFEILSGLLQIFGCSKSEASDKSVSSLTTPSMPASITVSAMTSSSHFPGVSIKKSRGGGAGTGSSKEKAVHINRCKEATWALLRLLVIQASCSCSKVGIKKNKKNNTDNFKFLDVLYRELESAIDVMVDDGPGHAGGSKGVKGSDSIEDSVSMTKKNSASNAAAHRRRCQELISAPKCFLGTEDGMKFPPEQLLHNVKGSDFSIAFWLNLTQDFIGKHRSLVVRGHKQEKWPVMLLRPNDRRIDIGYGSASPPIFSSNNAIPLNRWTHVALVSESNKLKLYLNGSLDCQRSNHTHVISPRSSKHALYVGKVPDGSVKLEGVKSGFEGSMAFLRFYSRALSPIHVRIVCDQGPPETVLIRDRKCYQICSLVHLVSRFESTRAYFVDKKWQDIFFFMFVRGTCRVQQAVVRLWKVLLPQTAPTNCRSFRLSYKEEGTKEAGQIHDAATAGDGERSQNSAEAFCKYLLRVIGLSMWKSEILKENKASESVKSALMPSLISHASSAEAFLSMIPKSVAACCSSVAFNGGQEHWDKEGGSKGRFKELASANDDLYLREAVLISSELVTLLQEMSGDWQAVLAQSMRDSLTSFVPPGDGTTTSDVFNPLSISKEPLVIAEAFAVLSVLGGHTHELRPGIVASLSQTEVKATVIQIDESGSFAHVVMRKDAEKPPIAREKSITKVSCEDLLVEQSFLHNNIKVWDGIKDALLMEQVVIPLAIKFLACDAGQMQSSMVESSIAIGTPHDGIGGDDKRDIFAAASNEAKGSETFEDTNENDVVGEGTADDDAMSFSDDKDEASRAQVASADVVSPEGTERPDDTGIARKVDRKEDSSLSLHTVVFSQARSRLSKIIYHLSLEPAWLETLIEWPNLIQTVSSLAVLADGTPSLATLDETESKVWFMRKQLFKLLSKKLPAARAKPGSFPGGSNDSDPSSGVVRDNLGGSSRRYDGVGDIEKDVIDVSTSIDVNSAEFTAAVGQVSNLADMSNPDHHGAHGRAVGAGAANLVCPLCGRGDIPEARMAEHVLQEHSNSNTNAVCPICVVHRGDHTLHNLASHMGIYHLDGSAASLHSMLGTDNFRAYGSSNADASVEELGGGMEELDVVGSAGDMLLRDISAPMDGEVPSELIEQLRDMGFRQEWCALALRENNNDVEYASAWIVDNLDFLGNLQTRSDLIGSMGISGDLGDEQRDLLRSLDQSKDGNDEEGAKNDLLGDEGGDIDSLGEEDCEGDDVDGRLPFVDNLEAEGARSVFEENYFGSDPAVVSAFEPKSANCLNYGLCLGDFSGSGDPSRFSCKTFESEISCMGVRHFLSSYAQNEKLLLILHCRAALLQLLQSYPISCGNNAGKRSPRVEKILGSNDALIQILKISCFRGSQFPLYRVVDSNRVSTSDVDLSISVSAPEGLRDFLCMVIMNERSTFREEDNNMMGAHGSVVSIDLEEIEGGGSGGGGFSFSSMLLNSCLDDLEAAASIDAFDEMAWGARILNASDSQTLLQPNVELSFWLLDLLLTCESVHMYTELTFRRIASCLLSANMPVKEVCMHLMWRIIVGWFQLVGEKYDGNFPHCNSNKILPKAGDILQLASECVPLGRLKRIANQRAAEEKRHERVFLSRFTQKMVQLTVATEDLLDVVKGHSGSLDSIHDTDIPMVERLQMSVLSENAISVSWGMKLNDVGDRGGSKSAYEVCEGNFKYEVEMATRTVLGDDCPLSYTNIYSGYEEECVVENLLPLRKYFCRARVIGDNGKCGRWCETIEKESSQGVAFTFDRASSGPSIFVSTDGLSASFGSNETWSTVMGSTPFISGVNYWEIKIDKSQTAYLFIGVATKHADTTSFLGGDEFGWGYIGDKALYHKRAKVKVYGEKFGRGDVIGVTLDLDNGTLSFKRNDNDMGVAFSGLAGELYPAVAFYNQGQRVSLVNSGFKCPDAGMLVKGSPNCCEMSDVKTLSSLMGSMANQTRLEETLMKTVWKEYRDWVEGRCVRYMTKCGFELQFDCSEDACAKFGLKAKSIISSPRGPAKVVGVCSGMLWIHVDDESGAWFVKAEEVERRRAEGYYIDTGVSADSVSMPAAGASSAGDAPIGSKATACAASAGSNGGGVAEPAIGATFESFRQFADCNAWTPSMDACIVSSINHFVERYDNISPWNLDEELLLRATRPGRNALKKANGGDEVSDEHIKCRYAILKFFNSTLVITLPYVAVGEGMHLSSKLPPSSSVWGLPSVDRRLSVCVSPAIVTGKRTKGSYDAADGLAALLVVLRNSVFFVSKKRLVNTLLERTVTQPKKAEDEYDYPEDLPQVILNRPKSISGKKRENPVARISMSMFGQLFDELHFIDPSLLRIGYTHPMDDGQERTFKVKFEGEGVDDYGGPYREIFGQVAGELQALETDVHYISGSGRKAEIGNSVKCVLPLLCPTRNWRGNGLDGGGRSVEEDSMGGEIMASLVDQIGLFVPNPSLKNHIYLEMYSFIGQIIGMALRSRITTKFKFPSIVWKALVGEAVDVEDLKAYDDAAYQVVSQVGKFSGEMDMKGSRGMRALAGFQNAVGDLNFTATLSDGTEVELCDGGRDRGVNAENCKEWVKRMTDCRLHESDKALFAMRDGLVSIIPVSLLPILTWWELELLVCGKDGVDIDLLQANTEYDDDVDQDAPHILSFWRVLRSFDNEDRSRFLRFVWARDRLPNTGGELHQRFKIQAAVGEGPKEHPDKFLPKAHTCFFSLNLPSYSSDKVMKEKLLYAIYNCIEMDADFKLAESENSIWTDDAAEFENAMGGGEGGGGGGDTAGEGGDFYGFEQARIPTMTD